MFPLYFGSRQYLDLLGDMEELTPTLEGCVPVTAAEHKAIAADPDMFYVNIHTAEFPDGAIRGQIMDGM